MERENVPKIIRADILGFCMGVRRAVEMANRAIEDYPEHKIWTLGPLIHNERALSSLAAQGVSVLEAANMADLSAGDVVVIRAHGVSPEVLSALRHKGCVVIDATCPRVMLSQKRAASFASNGFTVIIVGDRNHGEVAGIEGCAVDATTGIRRCLVVETRADAESLVRAARDGTDVSLPDKVVLVCQTTISRAEYDDVADVLRAAIPDLQVLDTICPATMERQNALRELEGRVDGVLIIGGKNSANTQRLLMAAKKIFPCAALIENATEIPREFFSLSCVGLSAGASTPDEVIDEVEFALNNGGAL